MDTTTRGSSEGTSRNTGDSGSPAESAKVGRRTRRVRGEAEPENGSRPGSGRRERHEIQDGAEYAGLSAEEAWGKIWRKFGVDVLSKEPQADRKLLIGLSATGDVLAPNFMAPKDYADLIFKIRESLREDGGSTQESAIEQVQRFLNVEKVKVETIQ